MTNIEHDRDAPQTFIVFGRPAGQGSKNAMRTRRGRTVMFESSKHLMPWRSAVTVSAMEAHCAFRQCAVSLDIKVRWSRAVGHFKKNGQLKDTAPVYPSMVDVDKLARSILDALTGVAYRDDRQVVSLTICREWCKDGTPTHAEITIADLPDYH